MPKIYTLRSALLLVVDKIERNVRALLDSISDNIAMVNPRKRVTVHVSILPMRPAAKSRADADRTDVSSRKIAANVRKIGSFAIAI